MLSPVWVYVCHTNWWQLHTQAGVKEIFSCSFCLRRLAMPEWWGQTIRMPRLFCFTFNLNLKPMPNYYCENCGHRFADVRQILTATCSRHPDCSNRDRHKLYEGTGKSKDTCKYCGHTFSSIMQMVGGNWAYQDLNKALFHEKKAIKLFQHLPESDDWYDIWEYDEWLLLGDIYMAMGNTNEARQAYLKGKDKDTDCKERLEELKNKR